MKRRLIRAVSTVTMLLALGACASLPTSGPVEIGRTEAPAAGNIQFDASGPGEGDSPFDIVQGFLEAGAAGLSRDTDFKVARTYLTPAATGTWKPLEEVVISANDSSQNLRLSELEPDAGQSQGSAQNADGGQDSATPSEDEGEESSDPGQGLDPDDLAALDRVTVIVSLDAVADLDSSGVYSRAGLETPSELTYSLTRVEGEWRIDTLPDGLMLPEVTFANVFRAVPLMFLSPDEDYLVPDVRYVPTRNASAYAMNLLIAGPSPWLASGVTTRIPDGLKLDVGAGLAVDEDAGNGRIEVHLSGVGQGMSSQASDLLYEQVRATMVGVPGVRDVDLWLDAAPYEPAAFLGLTTGPPVGAVMTAVANEQLITVTEAGDVAPFVLPPPGTATPSPGEDPVSEEGDLLIPGLASPAPGYEAQSGVAALAGPGRLIQVNQDGTVEELTLGTDLLPPTRDRFGYTWSGERRSPGDLVAIGEPGASVSVPAPFLAGMTVKAIRVSRDGARLVMLVSSESGDEVRLGAVVRDEEGVPLRIDQGPVVASNMATGMGVVWTDAVTIAVLGVQGSDSAASVRLITVTGASTNVSSISQADSIAAGQGPRNLFLATADGRLMANVSLRWEEIATGLSDPAFPG